MIKIHRKMVEEKEIIGDEIIIKECYEETEEFISLEQQISILKKAKTDKIYFRQNYENLIEFEWDLIRELGNENWNENWHKYFESDEDLLHQFNVGGLANPVKIKPKLRSNEYIISASDDDCEDGVCKL